MDIISLRSGSHGNAALIFSKKTKILSDCGISGKAAELALKEAGASPEELSGIVVSHEHNDHISGIGVMMRRYHIPVWANESTWEAIRFQVGKIDESLIRVFDSDFEIGDIAISPFAIPHDAVAPVGYTFSSNGEKVSIATDIGELKKGLFESLKGSKSVILEANHDVNMLEMGSYTPSLKRRIRGKFGHLSNDDAGKAAEFLVKLGTKRIILGHLSEENNYPDIAYKTVENTLNNAEIKIGSDVVLKVASAYDICI